MGRPKRDESEFFFRLSPDRVLAAVEAAGLAPTGHCTALNALENRVYDLRLEDGRHVVAKVSRPGTALRGADGSARSSSSKPPGVVRSAEGSSWPRRSAMGGQVAPATNLPGERKRSG